MTNQDKEFTIDVVCGVLVIVSIVLLTTSILIGGL